MHSLTTRLASLFAAGLFIVTAAAGCGGGDVDPEAALATAGCEAATATQLTEGENMLPGRVCNNCHREGGQAGDADVRWTVAGTIFSTTTSACNAGGVEGVKVDILKMDGSLQFSLLTNAAGNFYSQLPVALPLRARITKGGQTQTMTGAMATGSCPTCHQNPPLSNAPGRISLN